MVNIKCIICNKEFNSKNPLYKCCSRECFKLHRKNYFASDSRKLYHKKYKESDKYKQYRDSDKHKEYMKLYDIQYRKNPKRKKYLKWFESTVERKQYRDSEKYKTFRRAWDKTINGKMNSLKKHLKRRAAKNNIIEVFTIDQWKDKVNNTNGVCLNCKSSFDNNKHKVTLDHILPISKANDYYIKTGIKKVYTINDIQPLCKSCNSSKRDKINEKHISKCEMLEADIKLQ